MRGWWGTRRGWLPLCVLLISAPAAYVLNTKAIVLPIVFGVDGLVLGSTFLPLLWALAAADCFASKSQAAEIRPARRLLMADTTMMGVYGIAAAATFAIFSGPHEAVTGAAGHALLMTGLGCAVAMRAGAGAASLALCALLMSTILYGKDAPAGRYVRVLQPDGEPTWAFGVGAAAFVVALAICAAGLHPSRLGATERFND